MESRDFDRLVARAHDPRLVPGIYNYCDSRCARCLFTARCLTFLDSQDMTSENGGGSPPDAISGPLQRTLDLVAEIARRGGLDVAALEEGGGASAEADGTYHRQDPLAVRAWEYGDLAWRVSRAIAPVVAARGETSLIGAKISRALAGQAARRDPDGQVQTDFNGSAKVARLGIAESRHAWSRLMEAGKATADGVPAQAVTMLDALDAVVRIRFPQAMAFVRPGFDEPASARNREKR
jgi:hypothetical protein